MSTKGHKSDWVILGVLVAAAGLFLALLVAWGNLPQENEEGAGTRSSRSTGSRGTMACYLLYEEFGYEVGRWDRPCADETLADVDALFLLDPVMPVDDDERAALEVWVRGGGVLVCSGAENLEAWVHLRVTPWGDGRREGGRRHGGDGDRALNRSGPLARDVSGLDVESPRAITPAAREGAAPGQGTLDVLLKDDRGLRIAGRRVGQGYVVVVADGSFLSNRRLGWGDNAVLAVNLLAYALAMGRGGRVAFDEYHNEFEVRETGWSVLAHLVLSTPPGWAVLGLTAAGVLYLLYKGRRFGTRRAPRPPPRRSKAEYVRSVGATWRAAGANRLAFRLIFEAFRRRAAQQVGLGPRASAVELAKRLARATGGDAARYEVFLHACQSAAEGPAMNAHRLAALADRLAHLETEMQHGRGTRG